MHIRFFVLSLVAMVMAVLPQHLFAEDRPAPGGDETGVSHQLAEYRASTVSQVDYSLSFSIPSSMSRSVTGHAVISFNYSGDRDLPLDFKGIVDNGHKQDAAEAGQTAGPRTVEVRINGKRCEVVQAREHIVLPVGRLRQGQNTVELSFTSLNSSLNRHPDFMYTLFVPANARSCFPCFDQPDLKARFSLSLRCPEGWEVMGSPMPSVEFVDEATGKVVKKKAGTDGSNGKTSAAKGGDLSESVPISTYLFSFVAGKFHKRTATRDGIGMTALYRETDSAKVAQLDKVFDEAALSIRWLERYTGIPYPFRHYGFVVIPGYQFGGMEHPGAIQYVAREIFLGQNATPTEELTRLSLIAHETAHMWFGDLVTMRWFDDVWTKEVFANFMADKITREVYPEINHDLNFLRAYQLGALATDRTDGTHAIQQPLDNLKDAGLLYGNIIYDKAPVMMRKLEQQMGAERMQRGLQAYLRRYAGRNATWDDLIQLLDSVAPEAGLKQFSDVWVKQKGLPTITYQTQGRSLRIRQADPFGRGLTWPQQFIFCADYGDSLQDVVVTMDRPEVTVPLNARPQHIIPNVDGQGYGRFVIRLADFQESLNMLVYGQQENETAAYAALMNLLENYLLGNLSGRTFFSTLTEALEQCRNPLIASTLTSAMSTVHYYAPDSLRPSIETEMLRQARTTQMKSVRQRLLRTLASNAESLAIVDTLYNIWRNRSEPLLTRQNYTTMAYHLALMRPGEADSILALQRTRLINDDERREFDFVSRGCTPDTLRQRELFYGLIPQSGRTVEPWARQLLSLLCNRCREPWCNQYIEPGLDHLLEIQQSSDIFFPGNWLSALLSGQHSDRAKATVEQWISAHPDFPPFLLNKLKQAAYGLLGAKPMP